MNKILVNSEKDNGFNDYCFSDKRIVIDKDKNFVLELDSLPDSLEIIVSENVTCDITFSGINLISNVSFLLKEIIRVRRKVKRKLRVTIRMICQLR